MTIGNISIASTGVAHFSSLQVVAAPGDYQLRFSPLAAQHRPLAPATLNLRLRGCVVGEANVSASVVGIGPDVSTLISGGLSPCQICRPGTVSLDPVATGGCNRCDEAAHANCTGPAKIPNNGWWHSHPRSPLVHKCLLAAACNHTARAGAMQEWALTHAVDGVPELEGSYREYVEMQCAAGYQVRGGGFV
jgi:hypothetical protein